LKKGLLFGLIAFCVIVLDQATKSIITHTFSVYNSLPLIKNILHLTYLQNTGAGFSMLQGQIELLIWISVIAVGFILYFYDKVKEGYELTFVALVLGGTIGNLIDRLRLGYVVDFIDFRIFPSFNVADSALSIGVIGLVIYWFIEERKNKIKKSKK
jgi:signal peptidase II